VEVVGCSNKKKKEKKKKKFLKKKQKQKKGQKKKEKKMVVVIYTAMLYLTIKRSESLVKPVIEKESVVEAAADSSKSIGREKSISSSSAMSDQDRPDDVKDQLCCICFDPKSPSIWKIESVSEPLLW